MSSNPHLEVSIEHRIGSFDLGMEFEASAPWTVLFGASGSGKSTILRLIAGLDRPTRGSISIAGRPVSDHAAGCFLPPHTRPVRWSAQRATLFPHLSVAENIAFGLAATPAVSSAETRAAVAEALAHFQLNSLSTRRPAQLSGGEQQRVAVARAAIGARGKLLLLDEPFTGLDAEVRDRLIADLRLWLGATPVVSVTHSVAEALLLNAEVVRLRDGRVSAQGAAPDVLAPERRRLLEALA